MRVPSTLVLLGEPIEIETEEKTFRFRKGCFYLAANANGRELWVLPMPNGVKEASSIPNKAANLFKAFVGWEPDKAFRFTVKDFTPLHVRECDVISIAYRSSKWTAKATGYIHEFESRTKLQVNNWNKPSICRITGSKLKVKAVGITG